MLHFKLITPIIFDFGMQTFNNCIEKSYCVVIHHNSFLKIMKFNLINKKQKQTRFSLKISEDSFSKFQRNWVWILIFQESFIWGDWIHKKFIVFFLYILYLKTHCRFIYKLKWKPWLKIFERSFKFFWENFWFKFENFSSSIWIGLCFSLRKAKLTSIAFSRKNKLIMTNWT